MPKSKAKPKEPKEGKGKTPAAVSAEISKSKFGKMSPQAHAGAAQAALAQMGRGY